MNGSKLLSYMFLIGLLSNLVSPEFFLLGKPLYPSYIISIFMMILWILISTESNNKIKVYKYNFYIIFILSSMLISYAYALVLLNASVDSGDFASELMRYLPFIPYLLMFNHVKVKEYQVTNIIYILFLILSIVGILQLLGVEKAVTSYSYESHIDIALSGSRIVLTGSDPNVGSIIASFFMIYFLTGYFIKKSLLNLILALIAFIFILATQGRTTIIGSSIVIISYTILVYNTKILYKLFFLTFLTISLYYIQSQLDLSYLIYGLKTLQTGDNASLNVRFENIDYVIDNLIQSPIFGWGNSLENTGVVQNIDSEFFLILQRYGVFGLLIIFSLIATFIRYGIKFREERLGVFILLMTSSLIFNMTTNVVFHGIRTSSIIIFLLFCMYLVNKKHAFVRKQTSISNL